MYKYIFGNLLTKDTICVIIFYVFKIIALFSHVCQVKVVLICVPVSFCIYVGTIYIFLEVPDE